MSGLDQIAEAKIQKAMDAGEFDRLAGKGKPLHLEDNPFEAEGWGAAFRLIRQNGYSLPWIEAGMEIEHERLLAHRLLRTAYRGSNPEARLKADEQFAERIAALNQAILNYNLRVPALVFQRHTLDLDQERAAALSNSLDSAAAESQPQE